MDCWEVDMVVCVEASMVRMGNPNGGGPNAADATIKNKKRPIGSHCLKPFFSIENSSDRLPFTNIDTEGDSKPP